jgi:hypothetical protein
MVRTKGIAYKIRYLHTDAWKPSVLSEPQAVEVHYLLRNKVFFEVTVGARTRGQQKKQERKLHDRLMHGLPVEAVVQVSTNAAQ